MVLVILHQCGVLSCCKNATIIKIVSPDPSNYFSPTPTPEPKKSLTYRERIGSVRAKSCPHDSSLGV